MYLKPDDALLLGEQLAIAGREVHRRNTVEGHHWTVVVDEETYDVTLLGDVEEPLSVFTEQRRAS